jgi:hypothetical protein
MLQCHFEFTCDNHDAHFLLNYLIEHCLARNLMKRAENVVDCKIDHIWIEHDSLIFQFAKSKGLPDGEDHVGPWHVYANPLLPNVCPFLAMAVYLFSYPGILSSNSSLFPGRSQYDRFCKEFRCLLDEFKGDLSVHGFEPTELGTHSTRKGVATAVCSGCTMSPPIVSVCIRAGWTMGGVKDRYLKYEAAGDQFVGRCAAGLDLLSKDFAISPPHWDFSTTENGEPHSPEEEVQLEQELESFLKERLPNYDNIRKATLNLARVLLATVCYHHQYLKATLSQSSLFRASTMFRNIPDNLFKYARVKFPWTQTRYTPLFTGLPPHVLLLADNERIMAKIASIQAGMREDMTALLRDRDPVSNVVSNAILLKLDSISTQIAQSSGRFNGSGGEQMEVDVGGDLHDIVDEEMELHADDTNQSLANETYTARSVRLQRQKEKEKTVVKARRLKVGYFKNKLQVLPANWVFPSMTCYQLVINWLTTDFENNVPAFRLLKAPDVKHLGKSPMTQLRQMRAFMRIVEGLALENHAWPDLNTITCTTVNDMWRKVAPLLFEKYGSESQLNNNFTTGWKSLYNQMSRKGAFVQDG